MNFDTDRRRSAELNEMQRGFADEDDRQNRDDFAELLKLPAFRRVLIAILKKSRVFGSVSYDSTDTNQVMKMIGFRELGVDIYMRANSVDGMLVLKALAERAEIERERKRRIENLIHNGNGKART